MTFKMRRGFVAIIAVLLVAIVGMVGYTLWWRANVLPVLGTAPDFTLESAHGGMVDFEDSDGKVRLIEFIYTHCPDICAPTTMAFARMQEMVAEKGWSDKVQFVTVTFDPERDTPEVLRAYSAQVGADLENWWFLRGEREVVDQIMRPFGFYVQETEGGFLAHTAYFYLVDQKRQIRGMYLMSFHVDEEEVIRDIQRLL